METEGRHSRAYNRRILDCIAPSLKCVGSCAYEKSCLSGRMMAHGGLFPPGGVRFVHEAEEVPWLAGGGVSNGCQLDDGELRSPLLVLWHAFSRCA